MAIKYTLVVRHILLTMAVTHVVCDIKIVSLGESNEHKKGDGHYTF